MNAIRHLKSEFNLNRLVQTTIHVKSADTPELSEKYGLTLSTTVFTIARIRGWTQFLPGEY